MKYKSKVAPHCETVCLLSKLHEAKHHVNVTLSEVCEDIKLQVLQYIDMVR